MHDAKLLATMERLGVAITPRFRLIDGIITEDNLTEIVELEQLVAANPFDREWWKDAATDRGNMRVEIRQYRETDSTLIGAAMIDTHQSVVMRCVILDGPITVDGETYDDLVSDYFLKWVRHQVGCVSWITTPVISPHAGRFRKHGT